MIKFMEERRAEKLTDENMSAASLFFLAVFSLQELASDFLEFPRMPPHTDKQLPNAGPLFFKDLHEIYFRTDRL